MKSKTCMILVAILFFGIALIDLRAQGCSDAGFCTVDSLKLQRDRMQPLQYPNKLKIGFLRGEADNDIAVYGGYLEYTRRVHEKLDLNTKLNFLGQEGAVGDSAGPSDIYLNASCLLDKNVILTGGVKLPLDDGNRLRNGLSLPMDFQPSLGTVDLIFGIGFEIEKLGVTFAFQQPVTQNDNAFLPENYPENSGFDEFHPTNHYKRKGDMLIRMSYYIPLGKKWKLTPSLLPIFHLQEDEYTNSDEEKILITGSRGLTLNVNVFLEYSLNLKNRIEFGFGAPTKTRETRPDGLTREFVISMEYKLYM
jgi:hypothetical protein